jgi:hypothetical protein
MLNLCCGLVEDFSPQKSLSPQIATSQITNPQITKQRLFIGKFVDVRFVELILRTADLCMLLIKKCKIILVGPL